LWTDALSSERFLSNEEIDVYRVCRYLLQTQFVKRFSADVLPSNIAHRMGVYRNDGVEAPGRLTGCDTDISIRIWIPRLNMRLREPVLQEREM
jgi:hypothetical protein